MNNLKPLRKLSGKTQHEVAVDLGVPIGTYRNWEQGTRSLNEDLIRRLSEYYNVSADLIIGLSEDDRLTLTVYDDESTIEKRMEALEIIHTQSMKLSTEDMVAVGKYILFLRAIGSTNIGEKGVSEQHFDEKLSYDEENSLLSFLHSEDNFE